MLSKPNHLVMTNGYDFLANTIFFAQNVAQLGNFA